MLKFIHFTQQKNSLYFSFLRASKYSLSILTLEIKYLKETLNPLPSYAHFQISHMPLHQMQSGISHHKTGSITCQMFHTFTIIPSCSYSSNRVTSPLFTFLFFSISHTCITALLSISHTWPQNHNSCDSTSQFHRRQTSLLILVFFHIYILNYTQLH